MAQVLFEIPGKKFEPGTRIGKRYQILDVIGSGTVGTVLRATDSELGREIIALKVLHPHLLTQEQVFKRFQNEVLICRQLSHPNIVRVYDFDEIPEENLYFLSMECIRGPNLREYLDVHKGRSLSFEDAVRILNQIVHALSFAHQKGVIHRDVKPANILLNTDGNTKLTDFGLAQSLQFSHGLTTTGETVGTPLYMSPEHFGEKEIDSRSDIYSVGILAYEMLTGRTPFQSDNFFALAKEHLSTEIPLQPLDQLQTPVWFKDLLIRATRKHPEERFCNCQELLEELREHALNTLVIPKVELSQKLKRRYTSQTPLVNTRLKRLFQLTLWLALILIISAELTQKNAEMRLLVPILKNELQWQKDLTPLKRFFRLNTISPLSEDALHRLVYQDGDHVINSFLFAGVNPNRPDAEGNTPLHLSAEKQTLSLIPALVYGGANINAQNNANQTPLHLAVTAGNPHSVFQILMASADPNIADINGNTPLHIAARNRTAAFASTILTKSNRPVITWQRNKAGETPLHISVKYWDIPTTRVLLNHHVNVNLRDKQGRTPLLLALKNYKNQNKVLIDLLLSHGADITVYDNNGKSAADYWKSPESKQMLHEILSQPEKKNI